MPWIALTLPTNCTTSFHSTFPPLIAYHNILELLYQVKCWLLKRKKREKIVSISTKIILQEIFFNLIYGIVLIVVRGKVSSCVSFACDIMLVMLCGKCGMYAGMENENFSIRKVHVVRIQLRGHFCIHKYVLYSSRK